MAESERCEAVSRVAADGVAVACAYVGDKSVSNVIDLVNATDDNRFVNLMRLLEDALADCANSELVGKKAILIVLDDEDGKYHPAWRLCGGMKMSECIALLDVMKTICHQKMGFK